jgi:hypothetical protein
MSSDERLPHLRSCVYTGELSVVRFVHDAVCWPHALGMTNGTAGALVVACVGEDAVQWYKVVDAPVTCIECIACAGELLERTLEYFERRVTSNRRRGARE